MTSKEKVFELAAIHNIDVHTSRDTLELSLDSKKVFAATRNHSIVLPHSGRISWGEVLSDLNLGIELCNSDNCDDYLDH